jgi:hypothetical protein
MQRGDRVIYKGNEYAVEFAGTTKYGEKAKLAFLDGSSTFWVPLAAVRLAGSASSVAPLSFDNPFNTPKPAAGYGSTANIGAAAAEANAVDRLRGTIERVNAAIPGPSPGIPPQAPLGFAVRAAETAVNNLLGAYSQAREERNFFAADADALRTRIANASRAANALRVAGDSLTPEVINQITGAILRALTE